MLVLNTLLVDTDASQGGIICCFCLTIPNKQNVTIIIQRLMLVFLSQGRILGNDFFLSKLFSF